MEAKRHANIDASASTKLTPIEPAPEPAYSPSKPASPKRSYKDLFSSSDRTYTDALLKVEEEEEKDALLKVEKEEENDKQMKQNYQILQVNF